MRDGFVIFESLLAIIEELGLLHMLQCQRKLKGVNAAQDYSQLTAVFVQKSQLFFKRHRLSFVYVGGYRCLPVIYKKKEFGFSCIIKMQDKAQVKLPLDLFKRENTLARFLEGDELSNLLNERRDGLVEFVFDSFDLGTENFEFSKVLLLEKFLYLAVQV